MKKPKRKKEGGVENAQKKTEKICNLERHFRADRRDGASGADRNSRWIQQRIHDVHHVYTVDVDFRRSNGNLPYGVPLCPVPGAQVSPDPGTEKKKAAGNEKECIGTPIHICTHKNNQLYYDRFKGKNQIRKIKIERTDSLDHPV